MTEETPPPEPTYSELERLTEDHPRYRSTQSREGKLAVFAAEEDKIEATYRYYSKDSYLTFVRGLTIASQGGPRVFESVMCDFQRRLFEEIDKPLGQLRDGVMPDKQRFWIERTKKASKDADMATMVMWLLAFPRKPIYVQIGAANREQANIVKERISHLLHLNPWLNDHIEMTQMVVRSRMTMKSGAPMCRVDIMSSDVAGAHGGTPDLLIINELSHVRKWEFVENLMDNADGVVQGMVVVGTNAGFVGSKAELWRKNAITNEMWSVNVLAMPAPWHHRSTIEDAKRRMPRSRFLRLWEGKWVSGVGDAVSEEHIDRMFTMDGPLQEPESGWEYVAGLDLGISHDHSGLAVVGVSPILRKIKIAMWRGWAPAKNGEVNLIDVESSCLTVHRAFRLSHFFYDPHQAKLMAQRLKRVGVPMREMSFSVPNNLTKMATAFVQLVEGGLIEAYDDADGRLRKDFAKFRIEEKHYGLKLEAVSDEHGHADIGTAVVICLPYVVDALDASRRLLPDDELSFDEDSELTQEEVDAMPQELRELYNESNDWR